VHEGQEPIAVIVSALIALQVLEAQVDEVLFGQFGEQSSEGVLGMRAHVSHELLLAHLIKIRLDSEINHFRLEL